jgi:hypothetical protein
MTPRRAAVVAALALGCLACPSGGSGDDAADAAEADVDDDVPSTVPGPILTPCPENWVETVDPSGGPSFCEPWPGGDPAAAPVFTPCPEGWREAVDPAGGPTVCEPWPGEAAETCADDEAHLPGGAGCERIGTACPAGDWADDLPTDVPLRFVRAGAPAGGDGSRAAPFATVAEATAGAASGTVVAVARGTYDEAVFLPAGVTLWGACVAETLLTNSVQSEREGVINPRGREGVVRNLRIGGERPGLLVSQFRSVRLQDVVFLESWAAAIFAERGGLVEGDRVVLRRTRPTDAGEGGRGLEVESGSTVTLTHAVVVDSVGHGAWVGELDSRLTLEDSAILGSGAGRRRGSDGRAIEVAEGGTVELRRTVLEQNRDYSVFADGAGVRVVVDQVVIRRGVSPDSGGGVAVGTAAQAELRRLRVEDVPGIGIFGRFAGTALVLADVVVRDVRPPDETPTQGIGLTIGEGAVLAAERVQVERCVNVGVWAYGSGTQAGLTDFRIRDTATGSTGDLGRGLAVELGAAVTAEWAVLERNHEAAVVVWEPGSTLRLERFVVRDTDARPLDDAFGFGIYVAGGAAMELRQGLVERSHEAGVVVLGGESVATAEDVVVRETRGSPATGGLGRGIDVSGGARLTLARALLERNRECGLLALDPGTRVVAEDLLVRETLERECAATTCVGFGAGSGLGALAGAYQEATRFALLGNALCGVQVAMAPMDAPPASAGGEIDLHEGEVSGHPVGANVQTDGFDPTRLMDRVVFRENDRNLDMTALPVPGRAGAGIGP